MVKFHQPVGGQVDLSPGLRKSDKVKLITMAAGAVLVAIAILFSLTQAKKNASRKDGSIPQEVQAPEEVAFRPQVDKALLDSVVRDEAGPDRVMLEPEAVEELMRAARQMTPSSYSDPSIGARELVAAVSDTLAASPAPERGEPFFARGWIETIEERSAPVGPAGAAANRPRFLGRLQLEDQSAVYFLTSEKPDSIIIGDFVRVNGLFLKNFSDEDPEQRGTWLDGPLLVGRELQRSYPSFGPVAELDSHELGEVTDDALAGGISGVRFEPLWYLMAYARDHDWSSVDWNAAPELTRAEVQSILTNPAAHRFQPVRVPISVLMQVTVKRAGENPARIDSYTEGWIGNTTWKSVLKYFSPEPHLELGLRDFVTARGFFFKNHAYEPLDGGVAVAPVFILTDLEYYDRPKGVAIVHLGWIIGVSAVVLLVFLSFLLSRDKRSSKALQSRLTQRRRARRGATA